MKYHIATATRSAPPRNTRKYAHGRGSPGARDWTGACPSGSRRDVADNGSLRRLMTVIPAYGRAPARASIPSGSENPPRAIATPPTGASVGETAVGETLLRGWSFSFTLGTMKGFAVACVMLLGMASPVGALAQVIRPIPVPGPAQVPMKQLYPPTPLEQVQEQA